MYPTHEVFESVARYFGVLGEATRLRILYALCRQERCVSEIISEAGLAQANGSRHLGLMYKAGLLSRRREGTQVFYRLAEPTQHELCRSLAEQIAMRSEAAGSPAADSAQCKPLMHRSEHFPVKPKEEASV